MAAVVRKENLMEKKDELTIEEIAAQNGETVTNETVDELSNGRGEDEEDGIHE